MQVFRGMNETSINKTEFGGGRYEMTAWTAGLREFALPPVWLCACLGSSVSLY
jgi:hypothetical protein